MVWVSASRNTITAFLSSIAATLWCSVLLGAHKVRTAQLAHLQVQDQDGQATTVEKLQQLLIQARADARSATLDWVRNHAALIFWQLAAVQQHISGLQGRLLTCEVVLDHLKYRQGATGPFVELREFVLSMMRSRHVMVNVNTPTRSLGLLVCMISVMQRLLELHCAVPTLCCMAIMLLSAAQQLRCRYEREVRRGERSSMKRVLEQDMPASRMLALRICAHLPPAAAAGDPCHCLLKACPAQCWWCQAFTGQSTLFA